MHARTSVLMLPCSAAGTATFEWTHGATGKYDWWLGVADAEGGEEAVDAEEDESEEEEENSEKNNKIKRFIKSDPPKDSGETKTVSRRIKN